MEYDKMAQGSVISLGATGVTPVILPFIPTRISISNPTRATAVAGVVKAWWDIEMGSGAAMLTTVVAGPADGTSYITSATGTGFTPFVANLSQQYGPSVAITTITQAATPLVTTTTPHGLVSGDVVIFNNLITTATTGMQQLTNIPFVVTVTGANTFTFAFNNTGGMFVAYNIAVPGTTQAFMKKILYPFLYYPGSSAIAAIALGATTVVTTTDQHNFTVGQEVAFRIPSVWGTAELNSLPNVGLPGSPRYGFVTIVNSPTQVTVNINSTGFTAFTAPTVAQNRGVAYPQIVAVGDNNTGSLLFGSNSNTINGPAISGAYLNNTSMGFWIGSGVSGTAGDTIIWEADFASIT